MKRSFRHRARTKKQHLPDKNALWIVAFTALAIVGVILFFAVKPLIFKLLFLLIAIGAAVYCWLLIESRRIMPKPAKKSSLSGPLPETSVAEVKNEMPEKMEGGDGAGEGPQPAEKDDHLVFISEKGDKYHFDRKCAGLRFADIVETMPEEKALSFNRKPCSKCWPKAKKE
jgi:hypothetical protein